MRGSRASRRECCGSRIWPIRTSIFPIARCRDRRSSCPGSSRIKPPRKTGCTFLDRSASHYVCFRRFGNLVAADPRNGKTLWIRRDLPQGCVVFGDDRYVFVLQPHRDEAMVLRASDGELAGMRKMPPIADKRASDSCLAILGRKILLWQPQQDRRVLSLFDPLEGRQEWPERKFAAGARVSLIGEKAVGVMEPGGRFVLYLLARRPHNRRPEA